MNVVRFPLLLVLVGVALLWGGNVVAADGVKVRYDMGGMELTIRRDGKGVFQFDGLPVPGLVLYRADTQTVYYQHPDEPQWLVITDAQLGGYEVPARLLAGGLWQPWMGTSTRRWQVLVGEETCDNWFASPKAAAMAGLNVADISRVLAAVQLVNAGRAAAVCDRLSVPAGVAQEIGLPVIMTGLNGPWKLIEVVADTSGDIALPDMVIPLTDEVRVRLLLSQFGPEERKDFIRKNWRLPVANQIEVLENMLGGEDMP